MKRVYDMFLTNNILTVRSVAFVVRSLVLFSLISFSVLVAAQESVVLDAQAAPSQVAGVAESAHGQISDDSFEKILAPLLLQLSAGAGKQSGTGAPGGAQPKPLNFEDFQKILQPFVEHMKNQEREQAVLLEKRRKKMLEQLPAEFKELIINAQKSYNEFIFSVNIGNGLVGLCQNLRTALVKMPEASLTGTVEYTNLVASLEKLHAALVAGAFNNFLKGLDTSLDEHVLADVVNALVAFAKMLPEEGQQSLQESIVLLQSILETVIQKDIDALLDLFFTYLEPFCVRVKNELVSLSKKMEEQILSDNNDVAQKQAFAYWKREIQKNERTLYVFSFFKNDGQRKSHHTLFKIAAYAYDVGHSLLQVHDKFCTDIGYNAPGVPGHYRRNWKDGEHFSRVMAPWAGDVLVKMSMAAALFFNKRFDQSKGVLVNLMVGNKEASSMSSIELIGYNLNFVPYALGFLFYKPALIRQPSDLIKSYGNVAVTWIYYHLFYCYLFGEEVADYWPNDNKFLKEAVLLAMKQTNKTLFEFVSLRIRENTDPFLVEKIENATWGVIRPEMLFYIADSLIPALFLNKAVHLDKLANLNRDNLYGTDFMHKAGEKKLTDGQADAWYVEKSMIQYVMRSIGGHWGRIFSYKYRKELGNFGDGILSFVTDNLETFGYEETARDLQEIKNDLVTGFRENTDQIKELIKMVFMPGSVFPFREVIVSLLIEHGHVDKDEADQTVIERTMVHILFSHLTRLRILTYLDAALILKEYEAQPHRLDRVIDKTVDALSGSLVCFAGEWTGQAVMFGLGTLLCNKYGPFYTKVQGWMS